MRRRWITGFLLLSLCLMCTGCLWADDDEGDYDYVDPSDRSIRSRSYQPPGVGGARGAQNQRAFGQRAR